MVKHFIWISKKHTKKDLFVLISLMTVMNPMMPYEMESSFSRVIQNAIDNRGTKLSVYS